MKAKPLHRNQLNLFLHRLEDELNPRHPLYKMAKQIPWDYFEIEFEKFYSDKGRPAKPVRLMVGLLMLKQMRNLSDEKVVSTWVENPYYQYFCGEEYFRWTPPCSPSELVHFRKRIGREGMRKILDVVLNI